jgi:hypothetical protein
MTAALHTLLNSCFSPIEFAAEILARDVHGRLQEYTTTPPAQWFFTTVEALRRDGLLADPDLWTRMQRARPRRCTELHGHRRMHVQRAREAAPSNRVEVERVVATIAGVWDSRPAVVGLAADIGLCAEAPRAGDQAGLVHWLLQSLVGAGDGAGLFRLAAKLRACADDLSSAAAIVERLALAVCDGEPPSPLLASWLAVEPCDAGCAVSWRSFDPPAARDAVVPLDGRISTLELGGGMRIDLSRDGCALELAIRATGQVPWMGAAVRLCHGARSVMRTMISVLGDHLGDEGTQTLLLEVLELDDSSDRPHLSAPPSRSP